jgi:hypothetical protein
MGMVPPSTQGDGSIRSAAARAELIEGPAGYENEPYENEPDDSLDRLPFREISRNVIPFPA